MADAEPEKDPEELRLTAVWKPCCAKELAARDDLEHPKRSMLYAEYSRRTSELAALKAERRSAWLALMAHRKKDEDSQSPAEFDKLEQLIRARRPGKIALEQFEEAVRNLSDQELIELSEMLKSLHY